MRRTLTALLLLALVAGCTRDESAGDAAAPARARDGSVTISGDDSLAGRLTWRAPEVTVKPGAAEGALRERADAALADDHLFEDADAAIPLYLAALEAQPEDRAARTGLDRALEALLADGDAALAGSGDDVEALQRARLVAAVARVVRGDDAAVEAYLGRVDRAEQLWEANAAGERALAAGEVGEDGSAGAIARFRQALALDPRQPRALQGLAAAESALIRRAETAAGEHDFATAERWLASAGRVREGVETVTDASARVERMRVLRIAQLRDAGIAVLPQRDGIDLARAKLAELLRIARAGEPAATELRERIDLAVYYGLFRPGQVFTEAMRSGGRGPQLVVVPRGDFQMGAAADDPAADANEKPQRYLRFERGFALGVREVTVGEFGRFIASTGRVTRAARRGYSMVYEERSGNFVRRSGVDWRSDYTGAPATADMPVLHVSAKDAEAYAEWLANETGAKYRLPSEAEFEYALRAGSAGPYPWGAAASPPEDAGNFTGGEDRSPGGRRWGNAFAGFGDEHWGPAPVASFAANAWGVHDLAGNVSEWVADCWHETYRRAPRDGAAWVNPGCRNHVIRGGSWASAPAQTRITWRAPAPIDTTNARIGFRVARDL